ncbi:hypothetical protein O7600_01150 [Micromonospora sp. WMMA1998]|uniref:hypothetical protein n=1 Tax=Micromonospora sp. WMMA1998 TaxID=3015167 RepID=UPI00248B4480|nr:hypothetical protein [Micromonospora sp. WMMA1998]WBC15470.1 hypothetical protein O7600_01150 [Micromonospora sp. WMMA1998]
MVATHLRIAPLTATPMVDPAAIREVLSARCSAGNGVEHIRVRAGPHGADIMAFVDTEDVDEAGHALRRLVQEAIADTVWLRPWRIV